MCGGANRTVSGCHEPPRAPRHAPEHLIRNAVRETVEDDAPNGCSRVLGSPRPERPDPGSLQDHAGPPIDVLQELITEAGTLLVVRCYGELAAPGLEARRRRKTKSEVAREILAAGLSGEQGGLDAEQEARRQSLLVSRRRSEREVLEFTEEAADTRGWR